MRARTSRCSPVGSRGSATSRPAEPSPRSSASTADTSASPSRSSACSGPGAGRVGRELTVMVTTTSWAVADAPAASSSSV